jgi:hypothetical protein
LDLHTITDCWLATPALQPGTSRGGRPSASRPRVPCSGATTTAGPASAPSSEPRLLPLLLRLLRLRAVRAGPAATACRACWPCCHGLTCVLSLLPLRLPPALLPDHGRCGRPPPILSQTNSGGALSLQSYLDGFAVPMSLQSPWLCSPSDCAIPWDLQFINSQHIFFRRLGGSPQHLPTHPK